MIKKLNLACGRDYEESTSDVEWVNADISMGVKADLYFNALRFPYPISDEEYDYIKCYDFIEHVPNTVFTLDNKPIDRDGFFVFLDEVWRILKPGGVIEFQFPSFDDLNNYRDPTHTRRIMRENFEYYATVDGKYNFYTDKHWEMVEYDPGSPRTNAVCKLVKVIKDDS